MATPQSMGRMQTTMLYHLQQTEMVELIGSNEQVDQNEYGASVQLPMSDGCSGEMLQFTFISIETGTGDVQTPAGVLYLFGFNPVISVGASAMSQSARFTVIGQITVSADDWKADANGATACIKTKPVAFHSAQSIYAAWFHEDATSFNDGAGDDETLIVNIWYRRDR